MSSISDSCPEIADIQVRVFSMRGSLIPSDPFREFGLSVPEYVECPQPELQGRSIPRMASYLHRRIKTRSHFPNQQRLQRLRAASEA